MNNNSKWNTHFLCRLLPWVLITSKSNYTNLFYDYEKKMSQNSRQEEKLRTIFYRMTNFPLQWKVIIWIKWLFIWLKHASRTFEGHDTKKKQHHFEFVCIRRCLLPAYAFYMILSATFARAFLLGLIISHPAVIDKNTVAKPLYTSLYYGEKKRIRITTTTTAFNEKLVGNGFSGGSCYSYRSCRFVNFLCHTQTKRTDKSSQNVRQRNRLSYIPSDIKCVKYICGDQF